MHTGGECACTGLPARFLTQRQGIRSLGLGELSTLRCQPSTSRPRRRLGAQTCVHPRHTYGGAEFCTPRAEGNLIGRETELAKEHPSVPRHAIHSDEYLPPTELWKAHNDLIKAAWTALQLFENRFFYG